MIIHRDDFQWRVALYIGRQREVYLFSSPDGVGAWVAMKMKNPRYTWCTIIPPRKREAA